VETLNRVDILARARRSITPIACRSTPASLQPAREC